MWYLVHDNTEVCCKVELNGNEKIITNGIKLEFDNKQAMYDKIAELNLIDNIEEMPSVSE